MAESTVQQLRQQVADDPYDYQNWENLLREVGKGPKTPEQTAALREVYENIVAIFPTSCAYWKEYCGFEMDNGDEETIKSLFGKCLLVCLDIDLWSMYVAFIKSVALEDVEQYKSCLEFALEHVGQDLRSGTVWVEYLDLLKSIEEGSQLYEKVFGQPLEGQPDAAKTAALRRAIHRALNVPTLSLDVIWSYYESFENGLGNKTLAKRSLDEWRPKYHASMALCQERSSIVESLDTKMLPLPPGKGGYYQMEEAQKWREYSHWERAHPGEADRPAHQARVILAYEQTLSYFIQFPDIWLDYAAWHMTESGKGIESAISVLNRGREALPAALVLHFEAADLHEQTGDVDSARAIYEAIVDEKSASEPEKSEDDISEEADQNDLKTLAWIQYMRFVRRVDGVMAARKLFMRARKWKGLQWQAFVASARFEWLNDGKDHIPRNIFELGLKSFLDTPPFVVEYAKFLIGIGDLTNTRSLFERALTATPAEISKELWDMYIQFEAESGSLATVTSLESRRKEALKDVADDPLDSLHTSLLKYKFLNIYPGQPDMFEVSPDLFSSYEEPEYYDSGEQYDITGQPVGSRPPPPPPPFMGARVPRDLHQLMKQLQGPPEGPTPDIDHVLTPIMNFEFSAPSIEAHEAAMGRPIQPLPDSKRMPVQHKRGMQKRQASARGWKRKNTKETPAIESEPGIEDDNDGGSAGNDVYRQRMRKRS